MDLSPLNKNFLDVLHKLGIDVKDFPDKTFDGLFDNVHDNLNYFFNWFTENITSENVLTPFEQAVYFQLESNQLLPTQEEMDYIFASHTPTYEELQLLDPNYVKILLATDLEDLSKNARRLNEISTEIESNYFNIKEKHKIIKEESNLFKKQLAMTKQKCDDVNVSFGVRLQEVKEVLLKEPEIKIDIDLYKSCLVMEDNILDQIKDSEIIDELCGPSDLVLSEMKENLACVETSLVLTKGFLKAKKKQIEVLSKFLYKKSSQENFNDTLMQLQLTTQEEMNEIIKDIKVLESKLYEEFSEIGQNKMDEIIEEYFQNKTGVFECYINYQNKCKNLIKKGNKLDEALLKILKKIISDLENVTCMRKQVNLKLQQYEKDFSNSASNLELQSKRFKEVCLQQQQQHPFLKAVKEVINIDGNFAQSEETLNNIMELLSYTSGDAGFLLQDVKTKLQALIKHFDDILCGPTSEVLLTPVELSIKFQECVEYEEKLSHAVKQLASSYMKAKDSIKKTDRKSLLLWIKFLTQSLLPKNH